ncbi:MAG: transcription-repair coupling factor [Deltaproteobacteria bacterium]|nr:transcription-repair coupling factor [Deltaproteobacteria bacterium]
MTEDGHIRTLEKWIETGTGPIALTGLSGAVRSYFLSRLITTMSRPCLILLPDWKAAARLTRELRFFMPGESARIFEFPPYDMSPLSGLSPHGNVVARRLQALDAMLSLPDAVLMTSMEALSFRVLPKKSFVKGIEYVEAGEEMDRDRFIRTLEAAGYRRTSLVDEMGDYSVRGGVIDLFSPSSLMPVRLEFWGDRLESLRRFDPASQRSREHIEEMTVLPASEIVIDEAATQRARSMGRLPVPTGAGMRFPGQEAWLNHFYSQLDTLPEYLAGECLVILIDPHRLPPAGERIEKRFAQDLERFRKEAAERGAPFPETEGVLIPYEQIRRRLERHQQLQVGELPLGFAPDTRETLEISGHAPLDGDLDLSLSGKGRVSLSPLAQRISQWRASRGRVALVCRTRQQADRLEKILQNYDVHVDGVVEGWDKLPPGPGIHICLGRLARGFTWPDWGLYVVSEDEIFGAKRTPAKPAAKRSRDALRWSSFSQLKESDLVVHEEHGIGSYAGLIKMEIDRKANDFIVVEYAGKDKLYIPADRISILQKYVGAEGGDMRLDRLGGRSWNVAKEKAKSSVKRIAKQLVDLYAVRKYRKGYAFSRPDPLFREFEATFEHEETGDQIKAVEAVLEDMARDLPMDRLICGDVGFGKTEVAIRAAFKAVSDGKQVALLVPTTVLAQQHYDTFNRRLTPYSLRTGILSRFKTRAEQTQTLAEMRSGRIDILIGTHRILQKDVAFKDLGLLIIDEEQRFGVKQKEALKRFRSLVDVLAMTATPIPRTLHMSLMGVRDLSMIETPPEDRLDIETYLSPYDKPLIARAIQNELARGGQVFFVHNRVQTIDSVADRLRQLVPHARMAVAHGRMKERELEGTMMRFLQKEVDVLVCTTIIESGLDIPSANTIIIDEVDRLGLAQVYQLRGRVGRSREKAYAYLLLSRGTVLTRDAEKRLKALMDFSHLGAGLHLALHDLKIRGGGNILGFNQAGHISAVGYELYLKLIEKAVAELKGEEWQEDINPEINADISAFLPADYVLDTDVRLNLYRRLSSLRADAELGAVREEIRDRFGPLPKEAENLLGVMGVRLRLKGMGISRLDLGPRDLTLTFSESSAVDSDRILGWVGAHPNISRFTAQNRLRIRMPMDGAERLDKAQAFLSGVEKEWLSRTH